MLRISLHISLNKNIESVNSIDIKAGTPIITDDLKVCMPGSYEIGKPLHNCIKDPPRVEKCIPSAEKTEKNANVGQ
ncbi:protein serine/threonine kinase protein [Trichomonas vaginalis G3]|uniref:protein serine/threonine kinase protein n=1 Tax=Trichomonas vaginalis (strain ATCC PRA-98 / G3) TaxID=412133 RepID=UPI0021E5596F|nr:protein serine/threonine kinase protein [Trichomonas vaginalis G3]KAI5530255.1 protein serine/threonine kinase protein [Trichomonas vaginalis G3]